MRQRLKLTTKTLALSPLTIYSIPCNETSTLLSTGFGHCPSTLSMSIPIFSHRRVRYIPWIVPANQSALDLHYQSLRFGPRLTFKKKTITALDDTFNRLNGPLTNKIKLIKDEIASIKETTVTTTTKIIACSALALASANLVVLTICICLFRRILRGRGNNPPASRARYVRDQESVALDPNCQQCCARMDEEVQPEDA